MEILRLMKSKPFPKTIRSGKVADWKSAPPFVVNNMAQLIHRPRRISQYQNGPISKQHIAVEHWCGSTHTGWDKFTFVGTPPDGRIVCATCESRAMMFGEKSSSEIVGHHVCIGHLKAIKVCGHD